MNLAQITALTEEQSREYLESLRWPEGPVCPHCGCKEHYVLTPRAKSDKPVRKGVYKCKAKECRKQFTVTVGTIFERSHIALRHWVIAFHMMCASKKGVSAHQLHRNLGITYKSAWFMCHRIRHAMATGPFPEKIKGTIEADETYVGARKKRGSKPGRGTSKVPVIALVQRNGRVRTIVADRVNSKNIRALVEENVDVPESTLMTDQLNCYQKLGKEFKRHGVIRHDFGVYSKGDVTTNTIESFFALLKRGHYGIFHHFGRQHLQRYCDEFGFRWDYRKVSDSARREAAIRQTEGKRLMYK